MAALVLFLLFLVVPVLEIWLIIQVGGIIGPLPTIALLLGESLLGAWLVRREGKRAWLALQKALVGGVMPDRELTDAAMVLAGGVLLLTPGFITDVAGLLLVLPFTRPFVRRGLRWYVARRVRRITARQPYNKSDHNRVVRGEILVEDMDKRPAPRGEGRS